METVYNSSNSMNSTRNLNKNRKKSNGTAGFHATQTVRGIIVALTFNVDKNLALHD